MKIRTFSIKCLIGVLFIISISCNSDTKRNVDTRPNRLTIVADDHGRNDAGCYGNEAIHIPNIDYLAPQGVRMTNAYFTSASCSASPSVILSGLYNHANGQYGHSHGVFHFSSFAYLRSLPLFLEENGYRIDFELFDMLSDPDELINLADNPTYSEQMQNMKDKIKEFQNETSDPWRVKWEHE
jgi:arylsulfatase A-like enzyme